MKKIFLICALLLCAAGTFAATQYSHINSNEGVGIVMTEDASVVLHFIRSDGSNACYGPYPSEDNLFGYYTMDSKNNMISWGMIDLNSLIDGTINIGNFNAGDRIGFWAANASGEYIDSMNRDGEKGTTRDSAYVEQNGSAVIATMGTINTNAWGAEKTISGLDDNTNFIFYISTDVKNILDPPVKTVGQPLPGVFAALLLGAGTLGSAKLIRRKPKYFR